MTNFFEDLVDDIISIWVTGIGKAVIIAIIAIFLAILAVIFST